MSSTPLGTETYATYVDIDTQVKPWLQFVGAQPNSTTEFALQIITESVCAEAQRIIGGPIAPTLYQPTTGIGTFDGSGGLNSGFIMLPRYPVISIESVIEFAGGGTGVSLPEVHPTGTTNNTGYQCNYRTGRLTRVLGGQWNRPFYPGSNNIWVTWTAGYNPIPADLIRATLNWIAHIFRNSQQALTVGPQSAGINDEGFAAVIANGLWAGKPPAVADVLQTYTKVGVR